jgi:ABC-type lipoprotein release transport system permease subunit
MKASAKLRFASRILLSKKQRFFFTALSICIGVAILFVFRNFSAGLENTVLTPVLERSSPTTLIVRADFRSIGFLTGESKIEQQDINRIKSLPGVKSIGRQLLLGFPNSVRINLLGFGFDTDAPIFGVEHTVIGVEEAEFNGIDQEVLPITISPRLLDLFNSSFADALSGIPRLKEEDLLNREATIIFGKSSFFRINLSSREPIEQQAAVKHVSTKVPAIGLAVPLDYALQVNQEVGGTKPEDVVYHQLFLEAESIEDIPQIQEQVRAMGFIVENFEELGAEIRAFAMTIRIILLSAAGAIMVVAFFALLSLISVFILEQQKNIGILQAIGAKKGDIASIFFLIALIISGAGVLTGVTIGIGASWILNPYLLQKLPELSFLPGTLFPISASFTIGLILVVLFCSIVFAAFPIRRATKIEPIKAIWG